MSVVAIDGPSGVGKSSTAKEVARRLGYAYLDTGAMYRAMAWLALNRGVTDPVDVLEQVRGADLEISTDPDDFSVSVDGIDVTEEIRSPEVSENVQTVSAVPDARSELIERQRDIIAAAAPGVVVEGRDITTVVAPDAEVRLLMTARDDVRVSRRAKELHGSDDAEAVAATQAQVTGRDAKDSATTSFLTAADGVHTLDTSDLDFEQVVTTVLDLVKEAR
ncbi:MULTISPECIES: (d)CMP kinase [unclassified Brevibacterium]|uniref:(d)CMP kinase n=1 Tax=unclassified Brevibacterium TaxID=2614124 RepID=UPI0010F78E94|nr:MULTISPECIES: (d)CMP kinase [unclassified Brevibacterium]MCM1012731.1 (d)CMP kinase [Brevibacterium sp. XM4083]